MTTTSLIVTTVTTVTTVAGRSSNVPTFNLSDHRSFLDYLTAYGTLAAALFAGVASWVAWRSTKAAVLLAELERDRDVEAREHARTRQVRRVILSMTITKGDITEYELILTNASPDPIRFCRLAFVGHDKQVGPQLFGSLPPYHALGWTIRLDHDHGLMGEARMEDVDGRGWKLSALGSFEPDDDVAPWIEAGRKWVERGQQGLLDEGEIGVAIEPYPLGGS